jgi:hypothetical protein
MKKILGVILVSVVTVLVTLVVLWKLDVIILNTEPAVSEKVKKVAGVDELSKLLDLEYPRLGNSMEEAHELLGEVAFESEDQIDFYILEQQETLYVEFRNDEFSDETITSMHLYTEGEIEDIQRLGEKMLPKGYSFVKNDYSEIKDKNETFRYTKISFEETFIYNLPELDSYAAVQVTHSTSDLVPEKVKEEMPKEPISYRLEVFLIEDLEEFELEGSTEEDIVIESNEEEVVEEQEFAENNEQSSNLPFNDDVVQRNNNIVGEDDFLALASKGMIKGIDVSVGAPIGATIENVIGTPEEEWESHGGKLLIYNSNGYGLGVDYEYKAYPESPVYSLYLPIELSYDDLIQSLGEPEEEGQSEVDSRYYLYYQSGDYSIYVNSSGGSTTSFDSITLKAR